MFDCRTNYPNVKIGHRDIAIQKIYGAPEGSLGDSYFNDIFVSPPNNYSIDKRGRTMWTCHIRFDRLPRSYHKSQATAVRRMRKILRSYGS